MLTVQMLGWVGGWVWLSCIPVCLFPHLRSGNANHSSTSQGCQEFDGAQTRPYNWHLLALMKILHITMSVNTLSVGLYLFHPCLKKGSLDLEHGYFSKHQVHVPYHFLSMSLVHRKP